MKLTEVFQRLILKHIDALPVSKKGRPVSINNQESLDHIFHVCRTGMSWRDIRAPVSYVTIFRRMQHWSKSGVFSNAYKDVLALYRKLNPNRFYCVDSTYVKNRHGIAPYVGRNHTDRGRKALKCSVITDQAGVVHGVSMDPGNVPDVSLLQRTISGNLVQLDRLPLYADRGYDSRHNRGVLHASGFADRIFRRRTKTTRRTNARRIAVEHTFAWLDHYKRLNRFYERTPSLYSSFLLLALGQLVSKRYLVGGG